MGMFAIIKTFNGFQMLADPTPDRVAHAAASLSSAGLAILWAFVFDSLDGRTARAFKTTTKIGLYLDSLADMVTFCVAPAMLVYVWAYGTALDHNGATLGWIVSFVYLLCGAFRLARFNVRSTRPRVLQEGTAKLDKKSFVGLPTPAAAALLASIVYWAPNPLVHYGNLAKVYAGGAIVQMMCLSLLMVSPIRYLSFKEVGTNRRLNFLSLLLLVAVGLVIWAYLPLVFLLFWSGYVLHGPLVSIAKALRRRRRRTGDFSVTSKSL